MAVARTTRGACLLVALAFLSVICESFGGARGSDLPRWSNRRPDAQGRVVFPTEKNRNRAEDREFDLRARSRRFFESVPRCDNTTFCEHPRLYPVELVDYAVEKDTRYKYAASVDQLDDEEEEDLDKMETMDETAVCPSIVQIVYPKVAEHHSKEWKYIVNNNKFLQGLRSEVCEPETRKKDSSLHHGVTCRQLYTYRRLACILPDGSIEMEYFRMPSGCQGLYTNVRVGENQPVNGTKNEGV